MIQKHILVIKHGALGDIILATGPMQAIRNAHPDARITLLTTKPYDKLLADCPYIDEIQVDTRPKLWHPGRFLQLIKQLKSHHWDWVYDLQTSQRSTSYFRFLNTQHYSGLHLSGSHPHNTPERTSLHTIDRQKQQLSIAGIDDVPAPNIDWLADDIDAMKPSGAYVLFVPGGSAHRPEKRWPVEYYTELAEQLCEQSIIPVLIGTKAEEEILNEIAQVDNRIQNLCNQTNFAQIATLARHAQYAIGNDTGPMHIIAASGCASTVIFNTTASNPNLCAPRGKHVRILTTEDMRELTVDFVMNTVIKAA